MYPFIHGIIGSSGGGVIASTDFIIRVKTDNAGTSASNQFTLPLPSAGTYNYSVDWGDGVVESHTTNTSKTHTYPTAGTYTIKISGVFPRIYFNNGGDKSKLIETVNFGDVGWTSMIGAFFGCNNMTIATTCTGVMPIGSYSSAWQGCSSMTSFPALILSGGNNFYAAWYGCSSMTSFNATALGSGTFQYAWFNCSSMTSFNALDLSGGNNYYQSWYGCSSMTSFPALDLSGGTNYYQSWAYCSSMTSFNATALGSGTFQDAWFNCSSMTSFPALDLSGGNNFYGAWRGCSSMTSFNATALGSGLYVLAWSGIGVMTSFATRQFYGMTNGTNCFSGTTLPTADYSDILVTQRANNVNTGVTFHGGSSKYNTAGGTARGELVSIQSWSITDGGAV